MHVVDVIYRQSTQTVLFFDDQNIFMAKRIFFFFFPLHAKGRGVAHMILSKVLLRMTRGGWISKFALSRFSRLGHSSAGAEAVSLPSLPSISIRWGNAYGRTGMSFDSVQLSDLRSPPQPPLDGAEVRRRKGNSRCQTERHPVSRHPRGWPSSAFCCH